LGLIKGWKKGIADAASKGNKKYISTTSMTLVPLVSKDYIWKGSKKSQTSLKFSDYGDIGDEEDVKPGSKGLALSLVT